MKRQRQGTGDRGPGSRDAGPDDERDTKMTGIYVAVVVVEALIIAALWVFGRLYS